MELLLQLTVCKTPKQPSQPGKATTNKIHATTNKKKKKKIKRQNSSGSSFENGTGEGQKQGESSCSVAEAASSTKSEFVLLFMPKSRLDG